MIPLCIALMTMSVTARLVLEEYSASDMTEALFDRILMDGRVAVIRGTSLSWRLSNLTCEDYRRQPELSDFRIERVYGDNDGSFVGLCADDCPAWESDTRSSNNHDAAGPQYAPLYWEVRGNRTAMEFIDTLASPGWSFLSATNRRLKKAMSELWFSPPQAGAKAHMDGHIQATVATQLVGSRRWRLGSIPKPAFSRLLPSFLDSNVFQWEPEIVTYLSTGDSLVFPPGVVHDTLNEAVNSCAASITYQMATPLPAKYYRNNLGDILRVGDVRESWMVIVDLVSLGFLRAQVAAESPFFGVSQKAKVLNLEYDEEDPKKFLEQILYLFNAFKLPGPDGRRGLEEYIAFHDVDNDGIISFAELNNTFSEWFAIEQAVILSYPPALRLARYFHEQLAEEVGDEYWDRIIAFEQQMETKRDEL
jgi:hypothetical protein